MTKIIIIFAMSKLMSNFKLKIMKKQPDLTNGLSWLGSILNFMKEHSGWDIIKACLLLIIASLTLRICANPDFLFERYTEWIRKNHTIETELRETADQKIKQMLPTMLYKYHADRVWITQYHNGVSDWKYGSMRFEMTKPGIPAVKEQFDHIHMSWLTLPEYLKNNEVFIGTIEEFKNLDPTLGEWFIETDCEYVACTLLRDADNYPVGILGFMWNQEIPVENVNEKIRGYLFEDRIKLKPYVKHNIINAEIK